MPSDRCEKVLGYSGGTSTMGEHVKRLHPALLAKSSASSTTTPTATIQNFFPSTMPVKTASPSSAAAITNRLVDLVTSDLWSLNNVRDDGFLQLMAHVIPGYVVPSRTQIASKVKERHATYRAKRPRSNDRRGGAMLRSDN